MPCDFHGLVVGEDEKGGLVVCVRDSCGELNGKILDTKDWSLSFIYRSNMLLNECIENNR